MHATNFTASADSQAAAQEGARRFIRERIQGDRAALAEKEKELAALVMRKEGIEFWIKQHKAIIAHLEGQLEGVESAQAGDQPAIVEADGNNHHGKHRKHAKAS